MGLDDQLCFSSQPAVMFYDCRCVSVTSNPFQHATAEVTMLNTCCNLDPCNEANANVVYCYVISEAPRRLCVTLASLSGCNKTDEIKSAHAPQAVLLLHRACGIHLQRIYCTHFKNVVDHFMIHLITKFQNSALQQF